MQTLLAFHLSTTCSGTIILWSMHWFK